MLNTVLIKSRRFNAFIQRVVRYELCTIMRFVFRLSRTFLIALVCIKNCTSLVLYCTCFYTSALVLHSFVVPLVILDLLLCVQGGQVPSSCFYAFFRGLPKTWLSNKLNSIQYVSMWQRTRVAV